MSKKDSCCDHEDPNHHEENEGHIHEDHGHGDECCTEDHNHKDECYDDHDGCCCESGILENIDQKSEKSNKPLILMGISAVLIAFGLVLTLFNQPHILFGFTTIEEPISLLIFLAVVIIIGRGIIKHGVKTFLKGEVKIELLVTIATVGAFLLGDGLEGASLMTLFYLAEYIEHFALDRSKRSLSKLVNLNPDIAILKKDGGEVEVNVNDLKVNDIVIIKPGDKIPIDGVIINGNTSINQASITGESLAVSKAEGDDVYSSTINEEGYIEIKVTKTSENTIFAKIINLIKESEEKKAKIDLFIDKFAKYYTPTVVLIAIFIAIIPPVVLKEPFLQWIYRGLVLLVISCPCGLVISTPVSMVSAITAGTRNGIIIKGGEYIEELARIKAILFDKTGTLTEGKLEINTITPHKIITKEKLIEIACSIEGKSKHPIAKAFNEYKQNNDINVKEVHNFESIAGKGLKGVINNETYYIGKKDLFDYNESLKEEINLIIANNTNIGKTSVIIGDKTQILGFISLSDKIRENAKTTISEIKSSGIKTIMLTGDNKSAADNVSKQIGLNSYYNDLLPEDKLNKVEELAIKYNDVAMVGDGVNDTPSLARANVGIAMGMGGADVAVETADIVLMHDNISKISTLLNIAKKTMNIVKENLIIVISIKSIIAILGVLGYISLLEAVILGDMGITLIVVGNALRIR
ncbi:heavy metal translocating P-type ATPase [Methanobrevibacter filiformis]|uniref:Putative cadmium-transporting ATPase n=1 Tax=Methanobrevibacter filiformis TaxID=55758 RepID=A0A166ESF6_9EURY|nr:cation-translocating P-type ATPase [Methanobrevibacter filiformis]KZX16959.1 putative cadmium-transporting ATPase [Methanobrevibacter filiformis]